MVDNLSLQTVLGGHCTDTREVVLAWWGRGAKGRRGEGRGGEGRRGEGGGGEGKRGERRGGRGRMHLKATEAA